MEAFWDHYYLVSTLMSFRLFQTTALPVPRRQYELILNFNLQDQKNAIAKLNEDLCRISNWTFRNQLLTNPTKTMLIVFGSRAMVSKVEDVRLTLLGKEITPAAFAKVLGVILDSCVTYTDYIASTVSSWMAHLG